MAEPLLFTEDLALSIRDMWRQWLRNGRKFERAGLLPSNGGARAPSPIVREVRVPVNPSNPFSGVDVYGFPCIVQLWDGTNWLDTPDATGNQARLIQPNWGSSTANGGVPAGSQIVTPVSMISLGAVNVGTKIRMNLGAVTVGSTIRIKLGDVQELVTVTAITSTTFAATFLNTYSGGAQLTLFSPMPAGRVGAELVRVEGNGLLIFSQLSPAVDPAVRFVKFGNEAPDVYGYPCYVQAYDPTTFSGTNSINWQDDNPGGINVLNWARVILPTWGTTTVTAAIPAGSQVITPLDYASFGGTPQNFLPNGSAVNGFSLAVGQKIRVSLNGVSEMVSVTAITATTFTATFINSYAGGASITFMRAPDVNKFKPFAALLVRVEANGLLIFAPLGGVRLYDDKSNIREAFGIGMGSSVLGGNPYASPNGSWWTPDAPTTIDGGTF